MSDNEQPKPIPGVEEDIKDPNCRPPSRRTESMLSLFERFHIWVGLPRRRVNPQQRETENRPEAALEEHPKRPRSAEFEVRNVRPKCDGDVPAASDISSNEQPEPIPDAEDDENLARSNERWAQRRPAVDFGQPEMQNGPQAEHEEHLNPRVRVARPNLARPYEFELEVRNVRPRCGGDLLEIMSEMRSNEQPEPGAGIPGEEDEEMRLLTKKCVDEYLAKWTKRWAQRRNAADLGQLPEMQKRPQAAPEEHREPRVGVAHPMPARRAELEVGNARPRCGGDGPASSDASSTEQPKPLIPGEGVVHLERRPPETLKQIFARITKSWSRPPRMPMMEDFEQLPEIQNPPRAAPEEPRVGVVHPKRARQAEDEARNVRPRLDEDGPGQDPGRTSD